MALQCASNVSLYPAKERSKRIGVDRYCAAGMGVQQGFEKLVDVEVKARVDAV
jgi:hypothetical protein